MSGSVLFFDVFDPGYLPLIDAVARKGFLPIMNATSLAEQARARGLQVCPWQASIPAEIIPHVQREVDRITNGLTGALEDSAVRETFSSRLGGVLSYSGDAFFGQLFAVLADQIAALDIFDALTRQHDLRLIVLGCDNSHVQRALVACARRRGIPSLQLAHGIYAPLRVPVAGELHRIYADYLAAFGERGRDILVRLGNSPERILLTGAPTWDHLYAPQAQIDRREARRYLGLDPERHTVLFCGSYSDGSSGFFLAAARQLTAIYRRVIGATLRLGPDIQLIVRPHPREFRRVNLSCQDRARLIDDHINWLARRGARDVRVLEDHKVECIRAADVVIVGGPSTVIPEAMILGRPVVMFPFAHQVPPVYSNRDGIVVVEETDLFPEMLSSLLGDPSRRAGMVRAQNAVLPVLNHGNDGRASERVMAIIEDLAARSPSRRSWLRARGHTPTLDLLFALHDPLTNMKGGTELYTHDLARALERRGHGVRVLYPRYLVAGANECWAEEGTYQGLPVVEVFTGRDAVRSPRNDAIKPVVRRYLSDHRPDLVHVQHLMGLSVSFLEVLQELAIPVVLTANDFWFLCDQLHLVNASGAPCIGPDSIDGCVECIQSRVEALQANQLARFVGRGYLEERHHANRAALQIPELVLCPSKFLLDTFLRYGFVGRRMVHMAQGASLFTPLEPQERRGAPIVVSYLGSICQRKGLDILIAAFNRIGTAHAELRVHGEIVEQPYFEEALRAVGPGKAVTYHGGYGPADLPSILAGTDVAVVPSRGENFPFVIREILHARVPVIAPALSGVPEIVEDGVNGLLFRSNDVQDLATKLAFAIESPERIERWRQGIKPVTSIDEEARELEQHYQEILGLYRHAQRHNGSECVARAPSLCPGSELGVV